MANLEHYSTTEYSTSSEYKAFKAEVYLSPNEIIKPMPEVAFTGPESKFTQPYEPEEKESKTPKKTANKLKKFIDKIGESISNVAGSVGGAVAVAATAVVVCTTVFAPSPKVDLASISAGSDYVTFNMQVRELDEDTDYDILITNPLDTFVVESVVEGDNVNTVTGLRPQYRYSLQLVTDEEGERKIHFSQDFYTLKTPEYPSLYGATLGEVDLSKAYVKHNTDNYEISLNVPFENTTGENFAYRLTLLDALNNVVAEYTGTETSIQLTVDKAVDVAYVCTEEVYLGSTKTFSYKKNAVETPLYLQGATVEILDLVVENGNYTIPVRVNSPCPDLEIYTSLSITVDGEVRPDIIEEGIFANKIYYIPVYDYVETLNVEASLSVLSAYGSEPREYTTNKSFQTEILFETFLSVNESTVDFSFSYFAPVGSYIIIEDSGSGQNRLDYNYLLTEIPYVGAGQTLSYTLYDANGTPLSQTKSVTLEDFPSSGSFNILGSNPGDYAITYNEDGTMNLYTEGTSNTEDPDVELEVVLCPQDKNIIYPITTETYLAIENIPVYDFVNFKYEAVKYINGIRYVLHSIYPSGGLYPFEITIDFWQYGIIVPSDVQFVAEKSYVVADGKRHYLDSSMFVLESDGSQSCDIDFINDSTTAQLFLYAHNMQSVLDTLPTECVVKGTPFTLQCINCS